MKIPDLSNAQKFASLFVFCVVSIVSGLLFLDERHARKEAETKIADHDKAHLCGALRDQISFLESKLIDLPGDREIQSRLSNTVATAGQNCG